MRKKIVSPNSQKISSVDHRWFDLQQKAQVELTSEDAAYPIEAALTPNNGQGWRAAQAGEQTIRLLFDEAQKITRIQLLFREEQHPRTQEFVVRWSPDAGTSYHEIVQQQYTFSPPGTTDELEEYAVDLEGVTILELRIVPDIRGGEARASVAQIRIA